MPYNGPAPDGPKPLASPAPPPAKYPLGQSDQEQKPMEYVASIKQRIDDYKYWGEHPGQAGRHAECWQTIERLVQIIDDLNAKAK
jgi:hypothetical protein